MTTISQSADGRRDREPLERRGDSSSRDARAAGERPTCTARVYASGERPRRRRSRPGRCGRRQAARREARPRAPGRGSAGSETSRPPAVCGSYASATSSSGTPSAVDVRGREVAVPRGRRRSARRPRATSSAPASAAARSASSTIRTPLRSAISQAWPSRPKPVTSVTAFGPTARSSVGRVRVQASHPGDRARERLGRDEPALRAVQDSPVPSGFVRNSASPGCAPAFGHTRVGMDGADDGQAELRLVVAQRVPAGEDRARAAHGLGRVRGPPRPPRRGSSSGNAATDSASSGRPPIAKTSLSAFVAAIAPKSARVVDERREEVDGGDQSAARRRAGRPRRRRRARGRRAGPRASAGTNPASELLEPRRRVLRRAAAATCSRVRRRARDALIESRVAERLLQQRAPHRRSSSAADTEPSNLALIRPSRPTRNVHGSLGRCHCFTQRLRPFAGLLSL